MQKLLSKKLSLSAALTLALSGCLEVEDNSNDAQAEQLKAQNDALLQINQTLFEQSNKQELLTISGHLYDVGADAAPASATIKLKQTDGSWGEAIAVKEDGSFSVPNVTVSSVYSLLIESPDGSFLSKTLEGQAYGSNNSTMDIGVVSVSEGMDKVFSVFNGETSEPIIGLSFKSCINQNTLHSARYNGYDHGIEAVYCQTSNPEQVGVFASEFNAETSEYTLHIPKYGENVVIIADVDVDKDGEADYSGDWATDYYDTLGDRYISIKASNFRGASELTLKVTDGTELIQPLSLNLSLVDPNAEHLLGAELRIDDELNDDLSPTFNETTQQYQFTAQIKENGALEILIPEQIIDEQAYSGATVTISKSNDTYEVIIHGQNHRFFNVDASEASLDLVVALSEHNQISDNLEVLARSQSMNAVDGKVHLFYSSPIELTDESVNFAEQAIQVTAGNARDDDLIFPGKTLFERVWQDKPVQSALSLNDTRLTITPEILSAGKTYRLSVGEVKNKESSILFDTRVSYETSTPFVGEKFDIEVDMFIDNNNFSHQGEVITRFNTASEESEVRNDLDSVSMYFSRSIESLQNFNIQIVSMTSGGFVESFSNSFITLVKDGDIKEGHLIHAHKVARNESVEIIDQINLLTGLSISDGDWYQVSGSLFGSRDNVPDENVNQVTLSYAIEYKDGSTKTGTLTRPVR